ncbi:hypothetical protein [Sphingobium vermicomposti]|uniref:Uncharacterized protein n=1 Tax=Sphingobium vermicomposti TaxID=529005 RepID=A0A846M7R8_9SPHN|nr:hypothetical protein [Sphingobium vermicomposti]NIJ17932.1 hypothetical protein [Sphingobium vermicomposti]
MQTSETLFSTADLPRADRPIRLGSLLFTMVEPRAGYEAAYNRWYERDHFYSGCMIGPYTVSGGRYVATRAEKAKRLGSAAMDLSKGSYLALYWILDGHHSDWDAWAVRQVNDLHATGRMFKERNHIHTSFYNFDAEFNAPGSAMPIELALDRPYGGVVAFIIDLNPGKTSTDLSALLRARDLPGDVALTGSPLPLDPTSPKDVPVEAGERALFLSFSIEDPKAVWDANYVPLVQAIEESGIGRIAIASPFIPTIPGTDTYTDQL